MSLEDKIDQLNTTLIAINSQLGALTGMQKIIVEYLTTGGGMDPTAPRLAAVEAIKLHSKQADNPHCQIWKQHWEQLRASLPG